MKLSQIAAMCNLCGNPLCKSGELTIITMSNKKAKIEPKPDDDDDEITDPETLDNPRIVGKDDTGTIIWCFKDDDGVDEYYIRKDDLDRRDRIVFEAKKLALKARAALAEEVRQHADLFGMDKEKYLDLVFKFMDE